MQRILDDNRIVALIVLIAATFAGIVLFAQEGKANPSQFTSTAQTAAATSTLTYLTPGTASTTLVYDAYEANGTNQSNNGNTGLPTRLSLNIQEVASSTSSVLNVAIEHSSDNVDWYQDDVYTNAGSPASTSTIPVDISAPLSYRWTFASSTFGGDASATTTGRKSVTIPITTRYTRAVFTNTGARLGIWAQFVPIKERNN